jgi:transcriptional regulator with XRE-family HTH domain
MDSDDLNAVDSHVGLRIRAARQMAGLSQAKLGAAIGVSFQQIQKYERGVNRVGAGRLVQIAEALSVSHGFFLDAAPFAGRAGAADDALGTVQQCLAAAPETVRLLRAFKGIKSRAMREALVRMAECAAQTK